MIRGEFWAERTTTLGKQLWILWGSFLFSTVIYLVLGVILSQNPPEKTADPGFLRMFGSILGVIGVGIAGVSMVLQGFMLRPKKLLDQARARPQRNPGSSPARPELALANPDEVLAEGAVASLLTNTIILWAVSEAPAIFGLLLFFMSYRMDVLIAGCVTSGILIVFHRPRLRVLDEVRALMEEEASFARM